MKSRTLMFATAITLFAALAIPVQLAAQRTNGLIAFTQLINGTDGPANVFIANPDGSNVQQVPLPPDDPAETFGVPIWSPDGSTLLISHTIRVVPCFSNCFFQPATVDPSGSNFNQLVPPNPPGASSAGMDCGAWYPDGTRLLCGFAGGDQPGVFSIRASDGGDPVRLTTDPNVPCNGCDEAQDISPDGKQFVFLREKIKPNPTDPTPDSQVALFVEKTDGTGLRQLTAGGLVKFGLPAAARWSPDGTRIIAELGNGKMFTIRPDGTGFTAIDLQVAGRYFAFEPHWSPDGTRIIFCMFANGGEGIYTANPDGSNVKKVTFTTVGQNFTNIYNGPNWGIHPATP